MYKFKAGKSLGRHQLTTCIKYRKELATKYKKYWFKGNTPFSAQIRKGRRKKQVEDIDDNKKEGSRFNDKLFYRLMNKTLHKYTIEENHIQKLGIYYSIYTSHI